MGARTVTYLEIEAWFDRQYPLNTAWQRGRATDIVFSHVSGTTGFAWARGGSVVGFLVQSWMDAHSDTLAPPTDKPGE